VSFVVDEDLEKLFQERIDLQHTKLLKLARRLVPHATADDILQPNDFPELEQHPIFRYEEGVWAGLLEAKTAYLRWKQDQFKKS
jgi:hypothetical protein